MAEPTQNQNTPEQVITPAQPGSVITPSGAQQPVAPPAASIPQPIEEPETPELESPPQTVNIPNDDAYYITWTASEFVAHDKSAGWYFSLLMAAAAVSGLVYFITKDVISAGVVIVAAILLAMYGSHKPRQLQYRLDDHGLKIGEKLYGYHDFKSFTVFPEGAFASIVFMPLKRFAPPISIYFAPDDEDKILDMLNGRLPYENPKHDAVDNLMRRIRF